MVEMYFKKKKKKNLQGKNQIFHNKYSVPKLSKSEKYRSPIEHLTQNIRQSNTHLCKSARVQRLAIQVQSRFFSLSHSPISSSSFRSTKTNSSFSNILVLSHRRVRFIRHELVKLPHAISPFITNTDGAKLGKSLHRLENTSTRGIYVFRVVSEIQTEAFVKTMQPRFFPYFSSSPHYRKLCWRFVCFSFRYDYYLGTIFQKSNAVVSRIIGRSIRHLIFHTESIETTR